MDEKDKSFESDFVPETIENTEDNVKEGHHYGGVKEADLSTKMKSSFLIK